MIKAVLVFALGTPDLRSALHAPQRTKFYRRFVGNQFLDTTHRALRGLWGNILANGLWQIERKTICFGI